ncbi:NRDE family protein [Bacillus tianshenii]|nr:NRDE family protein [Bacillus tianshenii]
MCLILLAYQVDKTYPLIVAANRDEFYKRPTAPVHYWEDAPYVLAGRDLEKHGTWMGITKTGRFAALTNYRNPNEKSKLRSRGEIVSRFLKGKMSTKEYGEQLKSERADFPGYNVLFGSDDHLMVYSNVDNQLIPLKAGIYGLSNHLLDTPWPKVEKGKSGLKKAIRTGCKDEELFQVLSNAEPAPDKLLPQTGVGVEWERRLSPLFITSPDYGTRASTVLKINKDSKVHLVEQTFTSEGQIDQRQFNFQLR